MVVSTPFDSLTPARWRRASGSVTLALAVGLAGAIGLSGCATTNAQTTQEYIAPAGTDVRTGDVKALNMLIVDNSDGTGTVVTALVNNGEQTDTLELVTATDPDLEVDAAELEVSEPSQPIELPAGQLVQLIAPEVVDQAGPIVVSGDAVTAGQVLQLTLTFARAGPVTAELPVVARGESGQYDVVPTAPATTEERSRDGGG